MSKFSSYHLYQHNKRLHKNISVFSSQLKVYSKYKTNIVAYHTITTTINVKPTTCTTWCRIYLLAIPPSNTFCITFYLQSILGRHIEHQLLVFANTTHIRICQKLTTKIRFDKVEVDLKSKFHSIFMCGGREM